MSPVSALGDFRLRDAARLGAPRDSQSGAPLSVLVTSWWYTSTIPTALPRTQITHVERVRRILAIGRERYPDSSAGAILVNLAEERANELAAASPPPPKRNGLTVRPGRAKLTTQMVLEVLDED